MTLLEPRVDALPGVHIARQPLTIGNLTQFTISNSRPIDLIRPFEYIESLDGDSNDKLGCYKTKQEFASDPEDVEYWNPARTSFDVFPTIKQTSALLGGGPTPRGPWIDFITLRPVIPENRPSSIQHPGSSDQTRVLTDVEKKRRRPKQEKLIKIYVWYYYGKSANGKHEKVEKHILGLRDGIFISKVR